MGLEDAYKVGAKNTMSREQRTMEETQRKSNILVPKNCRFDTRIGTRYSQFKGYSPRASMDREQEKREDTLVKG